MKLLHILLIALSAHSLSANNLPLDSKSLLPFIELNDSIGDHVESFDFGAELYVSNDTDIEVLLEKIKEKHKGKTMILDLWGTFCGPCLKDFKNSSDIKKELIENDVVMVYLCAGISSKPDEWKKVIERSELVGDHIYMDRTITRAYMAKFKFKRYPGYLVIDKEGNYRRNLISSVSSVKVDQFLAKI